MRGFVLGLNLGGKGVGIDYARIFQILQSANVAHFSDIIKTCSLSLFLLHD